MNKKTEELLERTFSFGVKTLKLLSELEYNPIYSVTLKQLARCATSIGANYEEAQAAESTKDFIHKISIVSKETRESVYWLRIIKELYKENINIENQILEAIELRKIFITIKKTAQNKL